jgi:hypothetical protein
MNFTAFTPLRPRLSADWQRLLSPGWISASTPTGSAQFIGRKPHPAELSRVPQNPRSKQRCACPAHGDSAPRTSRRRPAKSPIPDLGTVRNRTRDSRAHEGDRRTQVGLLCERVIPAQARNSRPSRCGHRRTHGTEDRRALSLCHRSVTTAVAAARRGPIHRGTLVGRHSESAY